MRLRASILVGPLLLAACATEPPEWHAYPQSPSPALAAKKAKAESTRDSLMKNLQAELKVAVKAGGPVAGIKVCNEKAPVVIKDLDTAGVRIGRTSHKLRNPANVAPAWAQPFVDSRASKPIVLVDRASRLHALYPITLKTQCVICHGKPDQIPEPVRKVIAERYPADQATGFAVDDLRGWLWVEVD
jgi:Protein of unknown function (DUF3365)